MDYKAKDIAEIMGVSPSTVSMVLNNKPGVSPEKRAEILKKIEELGCGHLLKSSSSDAGNIGFVVFKRTGDIVNEQPFFTYMLEEIDAEARKNGFNIVFLNTTSDMSAAEVEELVSAANCAGLIIFATEMDIQDIEQTSTLSIPIVYLDNSFLTQDIDTIVINNKQGIFTCIKMLIEAGHTKIGYLRSKTVINSFRERFVSYKEALAAFGLQYDEEYIACIGYSELAGYRDMCRHIEKGKKLPTAFIADNDLIAVSAMEALKSRGYNIPDDISVVGFDNRPVCDRQQPPLTTIHVNRDSFGSLAFELLLSRLEGKRDYCLKIKVGTKPVLRESIKAISPDRKQPELVDKSFLND